ncbi:MAG: hypothetical protein COT09_04365, partial [Candidatus Hydromicrobium americanum]
EMKKTIVFDEEGNEVEIWGDTAVPIRIHDNYYKGEIEKIEDNKIYFIVDKKEKEETKFVYEDVEDYQVVFDINTYNFESDPGLRYYCDSLEFSNGDFWNGVEDFYSASELEFLLGKYLRVQDTIFEDYYTGDRYKALIFYLK